MTKLRVVSNVDNANGGEDVETIDKMIGNVTYIDGKPQYKE